MWIRQWLSVCVGNIDVALIVRVSSEGWGEQYSSTNRQRSGLQLTVKLVLPLPPPPALFYNGWRDSTAGRAGGAVRQARPPRPRHKDSLFWRLQCLPVTRVEQTYTTQHTVFTMLRCQTGHIMLQCHIARVTTQCPLSINLRIIHQTSTYMFAVHSASPNIRRAKYWRLNVTAGVWLLSKQHFSLQYLQGKSGDWEDWTDGPQICKCHCLTGFIAQYVRPIYSDMISSHWEMYSNLSAIYTSITFHIYICIDITFTIHLYTYLSHTHKHTIISIYVPAHFLYIYV